MLNAAHLRDTERSAHSVAVQSQRQSRPLRKPSYPLNADADAWRQLLECQADGVAYLSHQKHRFELNRAPGPVEQN